ncbi:MAG: DUF4199 domain-containing protein [Chitinophagales bacterium]|nr:DUF4199 domain-containing protein [Chitinophagales bacterium]
MKKHILIYGLLSGIIVSIVMLISVAQFNSGAKGSEYWGFGGMFVAFSLIFVALYQIRKSEGNRLSFLRGLGAAVAIAFITSTMYVASWMVVSHYYYPNFIEQYAELEINKAKANGVTDEKMAKMMEDFDGMKKMYKNPLFKMGLTYMEVLPIGIVMSLIAALVMMRKG